MKSVKRLPFVLIMLGLFISCQKGPECVMKIGSSQVTVDQVMPLVEKRTPLTRGKADAEAVKEYIRDLYARDLYYIEEAKSMGITEEDSIKKKILTHRQKTMSRPLGPLYKKVTENIAAPTAKQLQDIYEKRKWQYKLAHILVPSGALADSVFKALATGGDFREMVKKYSFDRRFGDDNGEWKDWFVYGTMGGDFDDQVVGAKPLQPIPPVHTAYGYQIVVVLKKKPRQDRPFQKVTNWLTNLYYGMERRRAFFHFQNSLPDKYNFKVDESVAKVISAVYSEPDGLPHLKETRLSESDMTKALASYDGGRLSVQDFVAFYNSQRPLLLPPLKRFDAIAEYAKTVAMTNLMYLEALKMGLDSDVEFQNAVRQYEVNLLRTEVYHRLFQPFEITEQEVQERYAADSTFHIQPYEQAAKWVRRAIRTERLNAEDQRQLTYLQEKYSLEFCEKGIRKILEHLKQ